MLNLTDKFKRYLSAGNKQLAAIVGIVKSFSGDEQSTKADWDATTQRGTAGVDFPDTTISAAVGAGDTSITVASTAGFTVKPSGYLILIDAATSAFEIVKYTGATDTTFTGLTRGQYGTTARAFIISDLVWQLTGTHGTAPDHYAGIQPKDWTQPQFTDTKPSQRIHHALATDGTFIYLYGGHDGTSYLGDFWKYDIANQNWTQITITGSPPGARANHTMVYSAYDGGVFIFGGTSDGTDYLRSTYFITTAGVGTQKANKPGVYGLRDHSACIADNDVVTRKMYIVGGTNPVNVLGIKNALEYNPATNSWTGIQSAPAASAFGDGVWMTNERLFFVFVRNSSGGYHAWTFDPSTNTWQGATIADPPIKRKYACVTYDPVNSRVLMFGGETELEASVDYLQSYSRATNSWTQLASYREIRTRAKMIWYGVGNEAIMWGGRRNNAPTWPAYIDPAHFRYFWDKAISRTQTMDLGSAPVVDGEWRFEDIFDINRSSISYSAEYSDDASAWTPIGTVKDGEAITDRHRYYRIETTRTCNDIQTPFIISVDAVFDQLTKYCLADFPVYNYPPIVMKFPMPAMKIDPVKNASTISGFTFDLLNDGKIAEEVVKTIWLKNKTIYIWIGFVTDDLYDPFIETDFTLFFKGIIADWDYDGNVLSIKCEDFIGDLKVDTPREVSGTPPTLTALDYSTTGIATNPVDIIQDLLKNQIGIPDRDIDDDSFNTVKDDSTLSGWQFKRLISEPTDTYEMILELCRHIGAVLIPREEGKLYLELYTPSAAPAATFNEHNIIAGSARFKGNAANVKNFISTWYGWDGDGDKWTDYEGADLDIDSDSITNLGREIVRTKSKWLGPSGATYDGDVRAADISARILDYAKNGIPAVTLETDLSQFAVQINDIIRVRMSMIENLSAYWKWMFPVISAEGRPVNPRWSIPYLAFGVSECVDMKFRVVKKKMNLDKGTISWDLWKVRGAMSVDVDSQADFEEGAGDYLDYDTTPGSVQIDLSERDISRDSLEAEWRVNTGSGGTIADSSDNTNTGTITGADWVSDEGNWCLEFISANSDKVDCGADASLDVGAGAFFISLWVKINGAPAATRDILAKYTTSPLQGFFIGVRSDGNMQFWMRDSTGSTVTMSPVNVSVVDNVWHHILVGTPASGNIRVYIDKVRYNGSSKVGNIDATTNFVWGFRAQTSTYLDAKVDEVKMASREPTDEEVEELFLMGRQRVINKTTYERTFDLGQQPERNGVLTITDNKPAGTGITYSLHGSEMGLFRGEERKITEDTIADAEALTQWKMRYYKFICEMTTNTNRDATPRVDRLKIAFPNG